MNKGFYRRLTSEGIGPGGWKCPCCAPAPGKPKRLWKRMGKKRLNKLFSTLVEDELKEMRFGV